MRRELFAFFIRYRENTFLKESNDACRMYVQGGYLTNIHHSFHIKIIVMKKTLFSIGLSVFLLLVFSCNDPQESKISTSVNTQKPGSGQPSPGKISMDDTLAAAQKWFALKALAEQYEQELLKRSERRNIGHLVPIDKPIGDAYMESYRTSLGTGTGADNTKAIIFSREQLAFYITYMDIVGKTRLQASYGRYDATLLTQRQLRDVELDARPGRNNKYTLIIGFPKTSTPAAGSTDYTDPFNIDGKVFYDDHHTSWP
jgi:hypothetical protein